MYGNHSCASIAVQLLYCYYYQHVRYSCCIATITNMYGTVTVWDWSFYSQYIFMPSVNFDFYLLFFLFKILATFALISARKGATCRARIGTSVGTTWLTSVWSGAALLYIRDVLNYHCGKTVDSGFDCYVFVDSSRYLPTFRNNLLPSTSG
jgi:hypothetical protein